MAMSDDQIRTQLGALLAEGHRFKDKVLGAFVMTGSSIKTVFPEAGQRLDFEVDGLGSVRLTLE